MSYLGKVRPVETITTPHEQYFSGDGSTVAFAMNYEPPTESALAVFIDGIRIHPDSWSFSGTTLTFASAPASGTNNIYINQITEVGIVGGIPPDGTITAAKTSGMQNVIQVVHVQDGAVATGTTTMPVDDTIPQNTEGDQYMSLSITPTSTTNILIIEAQLITNQSNAYWETCALFQDSNADALAVTMENVNSNGWWRKHKIKHVMTAGTTSATTFKIRIGADVATTTTFNGVGGARRFGGVMNSYMMITEVKP